MKVAIIEGPIDYEKGYSEKQKEEALKIFTPNEFEFVEKNLAAFLNNFGKIRIEGGGDYGFYVYYPIESRDGSYIQFCANDDYLDGWLYGVVQGVNRSEFKKAANMTNNISWNRMKELLDAFIAHESVGRNTFETIKQLMMIGFTGDELHREFYFDLKDINRVEEDIRECTEE